MRFKLPCPNRWVWYAGGIATILAIVFGVIVFTRNEKEAPLPNIDNLVESELKQGEIFKPIFGIITDERFTAPDNGKIIRINLRTKTLTLYKDAKIIESLKIENVPKIGSYWETPSALYRVSYKEENHFSNIAKVTMPFSVQFFGNSFIHGTPYDSRSRPVSKSFSFGAIRLSNESAKTVYDFADINTPVSVLSDSTKRPLQINDFSTYFIKEAKKTANLTADSYLIGDVDTGEIISAKNSEKILPIASVTKLMTGLVLLKSGKADGMTKITKNATKTDGGNGGLRVGEKLPVKSLLYPLLLESSNDAAEAIAEYIGRDKFLGLMNEYAESLDLKNTSFSNPSGLPPGNRSTSLDLFKMIRYINAHENEMLTITEERKHAEAKHTWYNINKLSLFTGFRGGKTGYIDSAKKTSVTLFEIPVSEFESRKLAIIMLKSDDRVKDHKTLFRYLLNNVVYGEHNPALALRIPPYIPPKPPEEVRLAFVGDIMLDRGVRQSVLRNFGGKYSRLFEKLPFLSKYDILFGNLEGPISDIGYNKQNLYSFRMNPDVIPALKDAGFDALSVANNHIGDWGQEAFVDTYNRMTNAGILAVGGGTNKDNAEIPKIIEKNGMKIGFLGFTDVGPDDLAASKKEAGILLASDPRFEEIITAASHEVDALIVSMHWGEEYKQNNERQKLLAHKAIDAGAKLIIGTHPHVVQDIETYEDGLIVYSLGNFIFDQHFSKETMQGMLLEVVLGKDGLFEIDRKLIKLNSAFQPDTVVDIKDSPLSLKNGKVVPIKRVE